MNEEEMKQAESLIRETLEDWKEETLTSENFESLISVLTDLVTSRFKFV